MLQSADIPFKFEIPFEVFHKAGEPGKERRIGGIISTEDKDRQGEVVLQRGLDFSEFVQNGWFNDNHSKATTDIVGYPIRIEQRMVNGKPSHYVEGYLLEGHGPADKIWNLANALAKTDRRLGFSIEGSVQRRAGPSGATIAKAKVREVAITKCFPGNTRVCGSGEQIIRRWYSGPMVEIVLASGEKLSGTPDHPVLTERGWVPLGELNEVHDGVACRCRDLVSAPSVPHHVQNVPATIEQMFDLSLLAGSRHRIGLGGERQLHGDLTSLDCEIDVVDVVGFLKTGLDALFAEKFGESALPAADKQLAFFSRHRSRSLLARLRPLFLPGLVSGFGQALALGGRPESISAQLFFAPCPGEAAPFGDVVDRNPGDFVPGSDCGRTLSRAVGFSNLVRKRVVEFSGHVFNLQCEHGWYEANGIVAHNCPVNTATGLEILAKSIMAVESEGDDWRRALAAGQAINNPGVSPGQGFALRTESMERKPKLTRAQAREFLQKRYRGMTKALADRIIDNVVARNLA